MVFRSLELNGYVCYLNRGLWRKRGEGGGIGWNGWSGRPHDLKLRVRDEVVDSLIPTYVRNSSFPLVFPPKKYFSCRPPVTQAKNCFLLVVFVPSRCPSFLCIRVGSSTVMRLFFPGVENCYETPSTATLATVIRNPLASTANLNPSLFQHVTHR